jgi:hypothetical protein
MKLLPPQAALGSRHPILYAGYSLQDRHNFDLGLLTPADSYSWGVGVFIFFLHGGDAR